MLLKTATQGKHSRHIHISFSASLSTLLGGVGWKRGGGSYAAAVGTRLERPPPPSVRGNLASITCNCLWDEPQARGRVDPTVRQLQKAMKSTRDTLERKTKLLLPSRSLVLSKILATFFWRGSRRKCYKNVQVLMCIFMLHCATLHTCGRAWRQLQRAGNTRLGLPQVQHSKLRVARQCCSLFAV